MTEPAVTAKRLIVLFVFLAAAGHAAAERALKVVEVNRVEMVENEYVVRFRPGVSLERTTAAAEGTGMTVIRSLPRLGLAVVRSTPEQGNQLRALDTGSLVEVMEPNYVYRRQVAVIPDDPKFSSLWGLDNTGQSGGREDADIDAPEAWGVRTDASSVVVAVIDSGIDLEHPDLAGNLWVNPGEIAGNGVDDDQNGYVDDVNGYNFVSGGPPIDDHRHGTHVSGTIGAVGMNQTGVVGVAWRAQIMACKFLDRFGTGTLDGALEATAYAIDNGARVFNNSWAGGGKSEILEDLIERSLASGVVYVAAAGNSGSNNDALPVYPSSYDVANVISVAALDRKQRLASFSNYGTLSVDLGGPGVEILSTLPLSRNKYGELSGTSMAAPHVAGVAALLLAELPELTAVEVKARLLASVDPAPALSGKTVSGGRLNAYNALKGQAGEPLPGPEPGPGCGSVAGGAPGSLAGLALPLLVVVLFRFWSGRRRGTHAEPWLARGVEA